jgi:hypothetical protein
MTMSRLSFRDPETRVLSKSKPVSSAIIFLVALFVLLAGSVSRLTAQAGSALLTGVVRDSSNAVIPDAKVDLSNTATGVVNTTTTNSAGIYAFNNILPGNYTLTASKQGFASQSLKDMHIQVQQALTSDFVLRPGSVTEEVSVQANSVELNTANASIGTVIEQNTVTDLPLNGRDFTQLLTLSPGASPINTGQSNGGGQSNPVGKNVEPSINGAQVRSNYYYLDGIDNTELNYDVPAIRPIVDDIAEFKVQGHNDEAQFGGVTGGIINVITKGGTNRYNGEVWEFARNTIFNANNPISVTPQKLVQNQYGFNGGGPISIPHLYNGKNRSFFFGSYEGFRRASPQAAAAYRVPTTAELTGDFSDTCPEGFDGNGVCLNKVEQIYNPFTTSCNTTTGVCTRQPFKNNNISGALVPAAAAFAKAYFPAPGTLTTTPGVNGGNPYNTIDARHSLLTQGTWSVRGDEVINNSNSGFFRISNMNQPSTSPTSDINYINQRDVNAQQYVASYVHTFGPSSVLDVEFGHSELTNGSINKLIVGNATSAISAAGFDKSLACNFTGGFSQCILPGLSIPNLAGGGENQSTTLLSNTYQYRANFTKSFSRHSISAGFNWESNFFHVINTTGTVTYGNQTVQDPTNTQYSGPYYGGLAAYFMGLAQQGGLRDTVAPLTGQKGVGFYVMDKWKLNDKLMVNAGFRYDAQINGIYGDTGSGTIFVGDMDLMYSGNLASPKPAGDPWAGSYVLQKNPPTCSSTSNVAPCIPGDSFAAVIANANANPIYPGVTTPANSIQVASDGHVFRPDYDGYQPRLGLAYRLDSKTSIRAGFGFFYDMWGGISQSIQNIGGTWPTIGQISSAPINGANDMAVVNWTNPISSASLGSANAPAPTPFNNQQWYRQPNAKNPYSEQWNFGVERELEGGKTIVSANYVGSETHHLIVGGLYNTATYAAPGTIAQVVQREPYPYIGPNFQDRSVGNSNYNALQVSVNHQASHGLAYLVAYTWSKNIDLGCDGFFGGESCSTPNPYDLTKDRSVAGVDVPQILTASFVAESPFGKNQRFTTHSSIGDYVIGNWSLNGIVTFTSGQDFNISESGDAANVNHDLSWDNYNRPDLVGNPNSVGSRTINKWFNTGAFQASAPYTFGNTPRNSMRGDRFSNLDLSVFRVFPIGESRDLQFRAEAFNVFNHPTWGNPDSNLNDSNFGQVGGTRSTERQLQLGMKLKF